MSLLVYSRFLVELEKHDKPSIIKWILKCFEFLKNSEKSLEKLENVSILMIISNDLGFESFILLNLRYLETEH